MLKEKKSGFQLLMIQAEVPQRKKTNKNFYQKILVTSIRIFFRCIKEAPQSIAVQKISWSSREESAHPYSPGRVCNTKLHLANDSECQSSRCMLTHAHTHTHSAALSLWSAYQFDHPCSENPTLNALSIHFHILYSFHFKSRMLLVQA